MTAEAEATLDRVLDALADAKRRRILAELISAPGASTTDLRRSFPGLSRWAVMKHLTVLREAGLIQTLPEGRRRRHFRDAKALAALRTWLQNADR